MTLLRAALLGLRADALLPPLAGEVSERSEAEGLSHDVALYQSAAQPDAAPGKTADLLFAMSL